MTTFERRSVTIGSSRRTITIESTVWAHLRRISLERRQPLDILIKRIATFYPATPIASALRCFVIHELSKKAFAPIVEIPFPAATFLPGGQLPAADLPHRGQGEFCEA